ncbi:hypothetical protein FACS1894202_05100 [Clostridia bacterium]|nr:hypothetical protein FACS1894202_05100 [Clostridia bacterium]
MSVEIARSLKLLRKEKAVSQRQAAAALDISQALLSHYENGAREPGLEFVCRACDYYEVSADYLIGRTMIRDGSGLQPDSLYDAAADKGNRLRGSAAALVCKKFLVNSISLLFDLLGRVGHKGLIAAVMRYLSAAIYKAFRLLYGACGRNAGQFFSVPEHLYSAAADAELSAAELNIIAVLSDEKDRPELPELSHAALEDAYPLLTQSLLHVLHETGDNIKKRFLTHF